MLKPMVRVACAAALVLCSIGPALLGQQAPRPAVPPRDAPGTNAPAPTGTAVVTGTVVMAGTGQPARKVRVNLSGQELRGVRSTTTDDQGRFSFTALPAGRYSLNANKPGHLGVSYGQRRPGTQGTPIQLSDGQKFAAQLEIPRGSVLTGAVLDENGEPTPNTPVRAMRYVKQGAGRTLQGAGNGSTDDRGIYRIFGLQPGEYLVCATPRNNSITEFDRIQIETQALRDALASAAAARVAETDLRVMQDRLAAAQAAAQSPDETVSGYAPVCYPGTTAMASAMAIPLGVGEERPGIDFQLQLVPMARVEGTIVNATGAQLQGLQVMLVDATANAPGMGQNNMARPDAEGRFRINGVAPGQYRLTARAQVGGGPGQRGGGPMAAELMSGRGRGGDRPEPITVWGSVDVVVDGRNVNNVMVSLQNGITVSGQITFEGGTTPPADLTRMRVNLNAVDPAPMGGNSSAGRVDASGRFTVASIVPGHYRVNASGAPGWFVESAIIGGQDALDFPFEVKGTQNLGGLTITMTDRQTEISGAVVDERNQPAVAYTLLVFPADSRYWTATRRFQTLRPSTDGRYTSRNLPPGEYKIAAVLDVEPGAGTDPAFLQQIESSATRVTLAAGEKKTQDIRVSGQ